MAEISDDELETMRSLADSALRHIENGNRAHARAAVRHLRDCL